MGEGTRPNRRQSDRKEIHTLTPGPFGPGVRCLTTRVDRFLDSGGWTVTIVTTFNDPERPELICKAFQRTRQSGFEGAIPANHAAP